MARRQREWQAASDQGLDELIGSPVPKMRLTPTIATSPVGTDGGKVIARKNTSASVWRGG